MAHGSTYGVLNQEFDLKGQVLTFYVKSQKISPNVAMQDIIRCWSQSPF